MLKKLMGVMAAVCMLLPVVVHAQTAAKDYKDPYAMIKEVADQTFARFHQEQDKIQANPDYLKTIVTEELMPYVDSRYAAYKVLGPYLQDTTKEQRDDFVAAFEGYLVTTYAQAFTAYTDQKVEFAPASDFSGERMVAVDVQIVDHDRPPIKLEFKVRRLKDDTWKAFDMVAEGVSLLNSKQSEVTSMVREKGIDAVITMLQEKANIHIDFSAPKGKDAL
ncbi:phospholipid-binding protein MlaC [Shewanella yunxiaonensis]|uniref:Phospholipid-binding protein MlaC n=1 Tax=Shewanella yunxiaonensis TaxID=2829809 RepID=A0ABX7YW08_9GAMM|nr:MULTISPECIES: phospholipid-binding protein MlaC [Shewanella]MDF0533044.1 phospholipid-binding protein MlaC [Shewanella sp. A32]QUN06336.1 phospholipid-binding protein MlaC [Shewanella yunxiaonensis]